MDSRVKFYICFFAVLFFIIKWIRSRPVESDPWDNLSKQHEHDDVINVEAREVELCSKCLEPIENPNQHYCPKCGNVTGKYTRYLPFVNIQFSFSIFGTLWEKVNSPKEPVISKIGAIAFVLLVSPLALIVWIIGFMIKVICLLIGKKK